MSRAGTIATAFALSLACACSGSAPTAIGGGVDPAAMGADGGAGAAPDDDPTAPHALGTIVLGESHASSASTPTRIVSVSFVPDANAGEPVARDVAGCTLTIAGAASPPAGAEAESFDAGPVAVSGATTPITLFPPYVYEGERDGSPFLAGTELRVQGSGAAAAGFEKFDEKFTATQFLQTTTPLDKLPRASVFGTGSLPVAWVPGGDRVFVTVSGAGGSLRCAAEDKQGRFEIPREVMKTALGGQTTITIALARERTETKKGKKTKGHLAHATVQPVGWIALSTTSIETASFTCSGSECTGNTGGTCDACRTTQCKTEYDACSADATCPMLRTCLDACSDSACRNACFVKWPDPVAKAKNGALYKCQCIVTCAEVCASECH